MVGGRRKVEHVGVNAVFLQPRMGGIETYVRELMPALLEERPGLRLSLYVNDAGHELLSQEEWAAAVELVRHPLLGRRYTRALTETTLLGWLASRAQVDVLHSVALTAPLKTKAASVLTVADVTWLRQPDPNERATTTLWRLLVPLAARRADRLIVHSEATRREVTEDFGIPTARIDVIPHGPGLRVDGSTPDGEVRRRLGLGSGRIVLSVSNPMAHKNLGALITAMAEVRRGHPETVLVLPGNRTHQHEELVQLATRLGIGDAVFFPGWLDASDLEGLYGAAACFAFPSLREGFGLPVLEAMRRGLPVACSNTSAVPEVAGEAAIYFDPRRPAEIAGAIDRLLQDRAFAAELAQKGQERQRLFSWQRAAQKTLACYERAVAH